MNFDIVIITYNREELLKKCLASILNEDVSGLNKIILINNGGASLNFSPSHKIEYFEVEKSSPAKARNFAARKCLSPWILFLDDDILIPNGYFKLAQNLLQEDDQLDILGGPDQCYPEASLLQRALGIALTSPMTTGHTRHRHLIKKVNTLNGNETNLILCHLWVRKSLFDEGFDFPENYFRNEENVFLERLSRNHKKILHKPDLNVYHYRKDSISKIFRSTFISAYFRKKSLVEKKSRFNLLYLIPTFFILYLFVLPFFHPAFFTLPLVIYILLSAFFIIPLSGTLLLKLHILRVQFLIHLAYGLGFLWPKAFERKIL